MSRAPAASKRRAVPGRDASRDESALKRDVALACRILAANGQADNVYGHVTGRLPGWDRMWMKPAEIGLDECRPQDLLLVDFDGKVLAGSRPRHDEYAIHAEIMRARPDVLSVVHTHPKFSIAFAARGLRLRPVSHEGSYFWPPEVQIFEEFTDLVRTREQGQRVARALGHRPALFLRNHGLAACGADVATATYAALMLERACEIQLLAQPTNDMRFAHTLEEEAIAKRRIWREHGPRAVFEYYARRLPTL